MFLFVPLICKIRCNVVDGHHGQLNWPYLCVTNGDKFVDLLGRLPVELSLGGRSI